jgi:hypothetical protein
MHPASKVKRSETVAVVSVKTSKIEGDLPLSLPSFPFLSFVGIVGFPSIFRSFRSCCSAPMGQGICIFVREV